MFLMSERTKAQNEANAGKGGGLTASAPAMRGIPAGAQVTTRSL